MLSTDDIPLINSFDVELKSIQAYFNFKLFRKLSSVIVNVLSPSFNCSFEIFEKTLVKYFPTIAGWISSLY